MAYRKSAKQELQTRSNREMQVYKRDDMIQKGRHDLSLQEQKIVLFAISKIQPEDSIFQEYTFSLKDFYRLCGLQTDSYSKLKGIMKTLSDRSWWIRLDNKGTISLVRWFSTLHMNENSDKVSIEFHKDMMPYLLELSKQGAFYTHFQLKYILAMKSQYSIRLYELLKSYQKNNLEWFFETEELKILLNCEQYSNFKDFRKRVLEPSVTEINEFTDIRIAWDVEREGRKVVRVVFYMIEKNQDDLLEANRAISDTLDGQIDWSEVMEEYQNSQNSVKTEFFRTHLKIDK